MASVIPIPLLRCLVSRRCGGGALTASLSSSSRQALGSSFSSRYMSTTEERQGSTASESGRFSDEIEELIAQAGAKADRGAKAAGSGGSVGSVGDAVDRDETLGGSADDEGLEGQGKAKVSLRAQKFRSMIKKFMPEKKVVVLKVRCWCCFLPAALVCFYCRPWVFRCASHKSCLGARIIFSTSFRCDISAGSSTSAGA